MSLPSEAHLKWVKAGIGVAGRGVESRKERASPSASQAASNRRPVGRGDDVGLKEI